MTTRAAPQPSDARRQANDYHEAAAVERRRANHHRADLYLAAAAELEDGRRSGPAGRLRTDPAIAEYRREDVMNHQDRTAPARRGNAAAGTGCCPGLPATPRKTSNPAAAAAAAGSRMPGRGPTPDAPFARAARTEPGLAGGRAPTRVLPHPSPGKGGGAVVAELGAAAADARCEVPLSAAKA